MRQSYQKHYDLARRGVAPVRIDPHHAGLPGFPDVVLWGELAPFLLMSKEDSVEALAEYALWQERPSAAKKDWLARKINSALSTKPSSEDSPRSLASLAFINNVSWSKLLFAETRLTLSQESEELSRERG